MGKFKFRLQTLLRIREQERDQRQNELNEALNAIRILEEQQSQIENDLRQMLDMNRQSVAQGEINLDQVLNIRRYEVTLLARQKELQQQHEVVEQEVQRRRERLVEANRQVKILEKLREKQEERHKENEKQLEIAQLDEIAGTRFGRNFQ